MYNVNDVVIGGVRLSNLFSSQDEKWHSTFIRPVKNMYSMSRVQEVEGTMDVTIKLLFDKLRAKFVGTGQTCEMSDWINFCEYLCTFPSLADFFRLSLFRLPVLFDGRFQFPFGYCIAANNSY
jgi:hypothetical protein